MKQKRSKHGSFPVMVSFIVLIAIFAVTLITTQTELVNSFIVRNDNTYDSVSDTEYDFIETEGKNGVKYYVITKNTTLPTSAAPISEESNRETLATTTTQGTTSSTTKATGKATSETVAPSANKTTAATSAVRNSDEKIAYLTFDDGPSINTEKLLDILDEYDVKATFFVIYHKNMEKKYKAIVDRGHTIALHSYTHTYSKIYKTEKGYYEDLDKIHDYIEKVTGVDSHIIRFPGGSSNTVSRKYNKNIMKVLKQSVTEKGYVFHDWNIDSTDASGINRDPDLLVEKVKAGLKKKKPVVDILMHDTGKSKNTTVEALPRIIEAVKAQGYRIEPLTMDSEPIQHKW